MTKCFAGVFIAIGFGLLFAPLAGHAQSPGATFRTDSYLRTPPYPLRGVLSANGKGYLIEPPSEIAGPGVREVFAYPDGNRVVVLRVAYRPLPDLLLGVGSTLPLAPQPVPGEASLILWNAATRKSTLLWRQRIEPNERITFRFQGSLPNVNRAEASDRAIVGFNVTTPDNPKQIARQMLLLVDADRATARQVNLSLNDYAWTNTSPTLPFAALVGWEAATDARLRFVRPDGSLTAPIVQPGPIYWKGWRNDGTVYRGLQIVPSATDPKIVSYKWFDANPKTGALTPIATPPKSNEVEAEPPAPETLPDLVLTVRPPLPQSETQTASVWLQAKAETQSGNIKTKPEAVLVSAEGEPVFLLPRAALYLSNGALYAAFIQSVNAATLSAIQKKRQRDTVIGYTKQIGLGLLRYIQDNNEKFPASANGLSGLIGPYLKNSSVLNGFVYTPPTPLSQAGMDNVSQVVLGHLPGDGGKAVLYADGHVKWQETP